MGKKVTIRLNKIIQVQEESVDHNELVEQNIVHFSTLYSLLIDKKIISEKEFIAKMTELFPEIQWDDDEDEDENDNNDEEE